MYKGVKKNQHYTWLICAAQNMKNIVLKKEKVNKKALTNTSIVKDIIDFIKNISNSLKSLISYQKFITT